MDLELWSSDPETAYLEWQRAEATGAEGGPDEVEEEPEEEVNGEPVARMVVYDAVNKP